jgi:hypothetical protein
MDESTSPPPLNPLYSSSPDKLTTLFFFLNFIALIKLSDSESTSNESSSYCTICLPDPAQVWTGGTQDCTVTGYSHPADSNEADGFLHQAPQSILEHCPPGPNLICAKGEKSAEACFVSDHTTKILFSFLFIIQFFFLFRFFASAPSSIFLTIVFYVFLKKCFLYICKMYFVYLPPSLM